MKPVSWAALAWGIVSAGQLAAQSSFPTQPPKPAPLAPAQFPPFRDVKLPNGIDLVIVERHDQPVASASLSFRAGDISDPPGKEGLSTLVADLITKGTASRSAEQLAATIEGVGGSLSANSGDDFLTISAEALSDQLPLLLELLGDVVRNPTFPESELALARTRALSALSLELSQPSSIASRMFAKEIYGPNPYGRNPTEQSYKAITRQDIVDFARTRIRPGGALLVVAGDVTREQVEQLLPRAFAGWQGAPPPAPAAVAVPTKKATDILLVNRPGSPQSNILVGNTTGLPTDSSYYAARVVTHVLGGGADSRMFRVLREEKSWSYDAHAALRRVRGVGYWAAAIQVRTTASDSALRELLHQINLVRTAPVPAAELTATKGFLVGSFPLTIQTARQVANQVTTVKLLGLDSNYLRLYRERLNAVTAAQAQRAAARFYHAGTFSIVVLGDGAKIYSKLASIAPVRIVDVSGRPLTPQDLAPKAGPLVLDTTQLQSRRDSFVVLVQGNPFGSRVTSLRRTADSLVYSENLSIGPMGSQKLTIALDRASVTPRLIQQSGTIAGQQIDSHLEFAGGRVKGRSTTPDKSGTPKSVTIDTTLAAGVYDDNSAINVIVPALPLEAGKTIPINVFSAGDGRTKLFMATVAAPESVTVPAGTFQAFKVQVTGGEAPFVLSVDSRTPRRIVKVEIVGAPLVFELVK